MHVVLVEDNPGDVVLITEYLRFSFPDIILSQAATFLEFKAQIKSKKTKIDLVFLDLILPDHQDIALLDAVIQLVTRSVPVVILTGNSNEALGLQSLQSGAADYLNKNDMNPYVLKRCVMYALERKKTIMRLEESNQWQTLLFEQSPLPMIVLSGKKQQIIHANTAALETYGYTKEAFLQLHLTDLVGVPDGNERLTLHTVLDLIPKTEFNGIYIHRTRLGKVLYMGIKERSISYHHKSAKILVATNLGERLQYIEEIYLQNKKFKEIAWLQSHVVRAPLSRIMGLVTLLKDREHLSEKENHYFFESLLASAHEMDAILHEITEKSRFYPDF